MKKMSKRESEVLDLICGGMDNRQICKELEISPGTVKSHLASLFKIFGVRNRLELAVHAYRNGLVRIDGGR